MIEPSNTSSILTDRPVGRRPPFWVYILCSLFPSFIRWWLEKKRAKVRTEILPNVLWKVHMCENRCELEKLMGAPKYTLSGDLFESFSPNKKRFVPDIVEVYATKYCQIEIAYRKKDLVWISGNEDFRPWDMIENKRGWEQWKKRTDAISVYKGADNEEEKSFLNQDINVETVRAFLKRYFSLHETLSDDATISKALNIMRTCTKCSKLSDIKNDVLKAEKAHKALNSELETRDALGELVIAYVLAHPDTKREFWGLLYGSHEIKIIQKYEHLVKK